MVEPGVDALRGLVHGEEGVVELREHPARLLRQVTGKAERRRKVDEIELDEGMIEVDDAIDASGKKFDLKLDPKTLAIVKRKAE